MSHFAVDDFGDGLVGVAPSEGAGQVAPYFSLTKLCDSETELDDAAVWAPTMANPPRRRTDVDPGTYRDTMLERAQELAKREDVEAQIAAFAVAALGAAQVGELDALLRVQLPALFEHFPNGSLWYIAVDPVLLARLAFGRTQLALQLTPDLPLGEEMEQLRALSDLTLTSGIDVGGIMNLPLLALSPAVLGFLIPALPHVLAFCFGMDVDLRRPYPSSFTALYRPRVLGDPAGLDRSTFLASPDATDGPRLVGWWVDRLNELYSHATDPTQFVTDDGYYDAAAQTAWMITLERLIGDAVSLLAEPQATDLDRVQISFDLLDKAESLLGYGRRRSGKGFEALLRRGKSVPRIRDALGSLPTDLADRLSDEVTRLFDELYAQIRRNTLNYRLTERGVRVASAAPDTFHAVSDDDYASSLLRAIRNSSHGLLEMLREGDDRFLLATNTAGVPAELTALAPLIALSLVADTPALLDGTWRTQLIGSS
jgi:hypothetical protein